MPRPTISCFTLHAPRPTPHGPARLARLVLELAQQQHRLLDAELLALHRLQDLQAAALALLAGRPELGVGPVALAPRLAGRRRGLRRRALRGRAWFLVAAAHRALPFDHPGQ